jgi:hypothetical protein
MARIRQHEVFRLRDIRDLPPNKIFISGLAHLMLPEGIGLAKWVAVRSGLAGWAIFYGHSHKTEQEIRDKGLRLTDTLEIPKLVPCTAGAFDKYRLF